jgi:uncharacterized protein YcfJ
MKKTLLFLTVSAAASVPVAASAADILARVISSTPSVQQVAVPRQVCSNQAVITEAPRSGSGALLGAVAGGAVGNAIGNGTGRALATAIGLVGGAVVGDRVEGGGSQVVQNVQQCSTQTFYENRTGYYDVVYEYQGARYNVQMANDPGQYVRLQVTPVGALSAPPQPGFQNVPQGGEPQALMQPAPYVQQVAAPVIYQSGPVYYPPPYYAPYYAPVGVSLNFGYSRGYGYGHRHWR